MSGGGKKQTVGYKYNLGMHMGIAHGPLDAVLNIEVDRRVAWEESTTGGTIEINAPDLFGGDGREGGVSGTVDIEMGYPDQTRNAYLQTQLGDDIPAFRGVACAVLNQVYMGNNPYLKPWSFKVARIELTSYGVDQWNLSTAKIGRPGELAGDDCLPYACTAIDDYSIANLGANTTVRQYSSGSDSLALQTPTGHFWWFKQVNLPFNGVFVTDIDTNGLDSVTLTDDTGWALCDPFEILRVRTVDLSSGSGRSNYGLYRDTERNGGGALGVCSIIGVSDFGGALFKSPGFVKYIEQNTVGGPTTQYKQVEAAAYLEQSSGVAKLRIYAAYGPIASAGGYTYEQTLDLPDGTFFEDADRNKLTFQPWHCTIEFGDVILSTDVQMTATITLNVGNSTLGGTITFPLEIAPADITDIIESELVDPTEEGTWQTSPFPNNEPETNQLYAQFYGYVTHLSGATATADNLAGWLGAYNRTFETYEVPANCSSCTDMNPAHIIRECLTDNVWGMGYNDADIDATSFEAAASTLYSEGFGLSIIWSREQPIEEFIGEILRHVDAVLYVSRTTGKFVLKLIREETPTITLNESNVSEVVNASRPTISELTNAVTVVFWQSETDEDEALTLHNTALRQIQGVDISTSIPYPGITNRAQADKVAQRDLVALSTPLLRCEITASRTAADLNIGDPFYLNWPDLNINNLVMRANEIDFGDGVDNSVKIMAVQDVFTTPTAAIQADSGGSWVDPATVNASLPAVARVVEEAPYYPLVLELGETLTNDTLTDAPDAGYLLASGGRQNNELNSKVLVDAGSGYVDSATVDFHPYAYVVTRVSQSDTELTIEGGKDLDLVEVGTIAQINSELVRVVSVNTDSAGAYVSVTVGRGILDTTPKVHELDDSNGIYIKFWGDFATSDDEQYTDGETISVKLQTRQGADLLDAADAPVDLVTFDSRAIRPYPPGNLRIDGQYYPEPYTWTGTHTLTWAHRDRLQQTAGDLFDHTEGNIGPEAGTTYRIEGYAYVGDSTIVEQFLNTDVGTLTQWGMDSNLSEVDSNMGFPPEDARTVVLKVISQRDGYDSWQAAEIELQMPGFTDSVGDSVGFDSVGDSVGDSAGFDSVGSDPWTPSELSSLVLWLESTDDTTISETGGEVDLWADRTSSAGDDFGPPSNPSDFTPFYNDLFPGDFYVEFDEAYLERVASGDITCRAAIFAAFDNDGCNDTSEITPILGGRTIDEDYVFLRTDNLDYTIGIGGDSGKTGSANFNGGSLVAGTNIDLGVSNVDLQAGGIFYVEWAADNDFGLIGRNLTTAADRQGVFNSNVVILLDSVPSTADRQRLEGYVAWQTGTQASLPGGHPYASAAPTV
jgi:hypothetical protein